MSDYDLVEISPSKIGEGYESKGKIYVIKQQSKGDRFDSGFPIPKKFVKGMQIQTFESRIILTLSTNSIPQNFVVDAQTQVDPLNTEDVLTDTVYDQIIQLNEELGLTEKAINCYFKQFDQVQTVSYKVSNTQYIQISKDINRTLLRIPKEFSMSQFMQINDLNRFLRKEYAQLNQIIFWQYLNIDQLLLNYLIFDCLEQIAQIIGDYQQGFNDICGSVLSLKVLKLSLEKKPKISYDDLVKSIAHVTVNLICKFKPLLTIQEQYVNNKPLVQQLNSFIQNEIHACHKQLVEFFDLDSDLNIGLYFFKWLLNVFSRDFSLNVMIGTHLGLRTLSANEMVQKAIRLCLRIAAQNPDFEKLRSAKKDGGMELALICLTNVEEIILTEKDAEALLRGL